MANIYELKDQIKACIQLDAEHVVDTEDGEILNLQQFEALQMERDQKIEGMCCYIKNKLAEADAIDAEANTLSHRSGVIRKEVERCKAYLAGALYGEKFETPRCKITWRKSEICNVLNILMQYLKSTSALRLLLMLTRRQSRRLSNPALKFRALKLFRS